MRTLMLLAAGLLGAGCTTPLDAPLSPTFGQAVASMQSQIIPAEVSLEPPPSSGRRAADAIGRLERGEVKQPDVQSTSDIAVSIVPSQSK